MQNELDPETREHLEALLNIAVQVAELQYDDAAREGMYTIVESLADYFGIERLYIETETEVDHEGNTQITIKTATDEPEPDTPEPDDTIH